MHAVDLELFKYMIEYTKSLLIEQCGPETVVCLEKQLASIPRHPNLKILKNGLDIVQITVDDFRNLMKVMIFVLDNLYTNPRSPGVSNEQLSEVFFYFNMIYIETRVDGFSETNCKRLEVK
jgi:hypothetical protein